MSKIKYKPFLMWFFPLLFFAYQFILRLWPGLTMQYTMENFSIDTKKFGLLAAFYYYGYAGMQIPVAILLDRFGARYIIAFLCALCGLSMLFFMHTDNFYLALLSRFLIGVGSSVGFLGVSKVISEWFSPNQYAKMVGFSFTFGLMGAVYGGRPISSLIEQYGEYSIALGLSIISLIIAVMIYLALENKSDNSKSETNFNISDLKSIIYSPIVWCVAISNLLMVGVLEGFADIWGVQYLMIAYDIEKSDAAGIISFIFLGMLFGGPLLALLNKKLGSYTIIALCGLGMGSIFCLVLSYYLSTFILMSLFFIVGLMCCYQVIIFSASAKLVEPKNLGITIAFLNSINMLGGSFFHTIIGMIMEKNTTSIVVQDVKSYEYALSIIPICAILGAIIICLIGIRLRYNTMVSGEA